MKFDSFRALVDLYTAGQMNCWCISLLIIMIIGAAAGFYYYFKVIREMYWEKPHAEDKPLCIPMMTAGVMAACAILLIIYGTWPLLTGNL